MGNQDEYLRNFTVLLTEKGVVPLTDPMQIAVYDELCSGSKRPSDISASLGIPSSSLHFVLDKMTDSGVIVRYKPDADKKSVYYSNLALKIAGSEQPREGAEAECEDTFRDPSRYYSGMSSVANMLDQYSAEIGLSLDQLRVKYADELADSMKIEIGSGSLEDSILEIKERFARITGFRFSVFALNPLTLVFEGDRVCPSSSAARLETPPAGPTPSSRRRTSGPTTPPGSRSSTRGSRRSPSPTSTCHFTRPGRCPGSSWWSWTAPSGS